MTAHPPESLRLRLGDALLIVDVQQDFLPAGNLPVPDGDRVVPVLNRYITLFRERSLPIFATRDWHPPNHCSFHAQGGEWPAHCVAETAGAAFATELDLPENSVVVSKAERQERDAYSGFDGTNLEQQLREAEVSRLFIGGLATDYCVLNSVKDALRAGFEVLLLQDAIRAVNVQPYDGDKAIEEMRNNGAQLIRIEDIQ